MTNEEILSKALEKAEKNGYSRHIQYLPLFLKRNPKTKERFTKEELLKLMARIWYTRKNDIIFDHNFAKAFWGTCYHKWGIRDNIYGTKQCSICKDFQCDDENIPFELWKFHLQQMILEEDPVKYLEKFL